MTESWFRAEAFGDLDCDGERAFFAATEKSTREQVTSLAPVSLTSQTNWSRTPYRKSLGLFAGETWTKGYFSIHQLHRSVGQAGVR